MTAKEYMEQARYLDMQINSKIEQIRRTSLRQKLQQSTAIRPTVQTETLPEWKKPL